MTDDLMTIKQVAELMACTQMTVRRRIKAGAFGAVIRDGNKMIRIRRYAVEEYIKSKTEGAHHDN